MRELTFVMAPGQNAFFKELGAALAEEVRRLGVDVRQTQGWPPPEDGRAYALVAPHEHVIIAGPSGLPAAVLPRTVCVCTEQPWSTWFEDSARIASRCGGVFDISAASAELLRRRGIGAEHLQLGYTPSWDRFGADGGRDVDVAFLAGATARRERLLARCGPILARHRCRLVLGDSSRTNPEDSQSFIAGNSKLALLGRSRVVLNIHRHRDPYFEWVRVLEAIHCGAAVLSEWSPDFEPLIAGRHFLSARPEALPAMLEMLLADEETRLRLAAEAYGFIRSELPLRASAERLAEVAERAAGRRLRRNARYLGRPPEPTARDLLRLLLPSSYHPPKQLDPSPTVKRARLEVAELRRGLERLLEQERRGAPPPPLERVASTPAHESAEPPRISVICALYNDASRVGEALRSVLAQSRRDWELVVCDDGSGDGSTEVVGRFLEQHPEAPALLVRHPVNRGLPAARNSAIAECRGEFVLVLDSDNQLYPHCLERLGEALEADPAAAFAYGILEQFDHRGPVGLSGYFGWEPERLVEDNYIDALALLRRSAMAELGGYSEDRRLYGWEDYDLWCRIADRGGHGVHVPEIVARYRLAAGSMIALTNLAPGEAREALAERSPRLFEGLEVAQEEDLPRVLITP